MCGGAAIPMGSLFCRFPAPTPYSAQESHRHGAQAQEALRDLLRHTTRKWQKSAENDWQLLGTHFSKLAWTFVLYGTADESLLDALGIMGLGDRAHTNCV